MSCIFWHFGFLPHIHDLLNQDPQRLSAPCCTWQACTQRGSPPASTSPLSSATASSPARLAPCWHGSTTASLPSSALTRSYNLQWTFSYRLLSSHVALGEFNARFFCQFFAISTNFSPSSQFLLCSIPGFCIFHTSELTAWAETSLDLYSRCWAGWTPRPGWMPPSPYSVQESPGPGSWPGAGSAPG